MPPKFTLQSVLNYHHKRVELLEMELGRLRHEAHDVQLQIDECRVRRESLFEEARQQQTESLDMGAVLRLRQQIGGDPFAVMAAFARLSAQNLAPARLGPFRRRGGAKPVAHPRPCISSARL